MDGWYCDDDEAGHSIRILDSFGGSFCSTSSNDVLGSAKNGGWACDLDQLRDSDLLNSQIYQCAVLLGCRREESEFGMTSRSNHIINTQMDDQDFFHEDLVQHSQLEQFFSHQEHSPQSSSPPSSLQSLSMGRKVTNSNVSCNPLIAKEVAQQAATTMQAYNQHRNVQIPSHESDDAAIMRAMMAVISSSNSSSAASSPSVMSNPQQQEAPTYQPQAKLPLQAFRPYRSALAPKLEPGKNSCSQKMIKDSILLLRRISSVQSEEQVEGLARSTSNQLHHMISERRRREKLNDSFHALRMLLPPGSKKDKAAVLTNARNYLNTLKSQICELEEQNRKLETHLSRDETRNGSGSNGSVRIQIIKASEPTSEVQQINIKITVRAECDIVELVLHVLECLRGLRVVSVASVDAYTYSPQMHIFARANLMVQIKRCDWDEAAFQEVINKAIGGVSSLHTDQ